MKRLHLLVIRSFVGPFLFMFLVVVFLFLMQGVWRYIDLLTGKGLEIGIILEFLAYVAVTTVPMALPLSILLASIMTFGNLGENYELTAIKSSGIHLFRLMSPLIIITIGLSIGAFYFQNNILPVTILKAKTLQADIISQNPSFSLQSGIFNNNIPGWSIKVGRIDNETDILHNVIIYKHTKPNEYSSVIIAEKGKMNNTKNNRFLNITLYNGASYSDYSKEKTYPLRKGKFDEYTFPIELPDFSLKRSDGENFKDDYRMLTVTQLIEVKKSKIELFDKMNDNNALNIANNKYLKEENIKLKQDSAYQEKIKDKTLNADSLFLRLNERDSRIAIGSALIFAEDILQSLKGEYGKIETNKTWQRWLRRYDIEWHRKFTLSLACLVFLFIGAPLGAIIRKGGLGMPVIVSIVMFILYYVLTKSTENMAREGLVSATTGMWIPFALFLPMGFFLTYKATTDAALMNTDAYYKFFKKMDAFFKQQIKKGESAFKFKMFRN